MEAFPLIMLAGLAAVFWLLVLRPAKAKQKAQQQLLGGIGVGTEIMTTAGVFGTVVAVDDDKFSLKIAPGVEILMLKAAIAKVIDDQPAEIADSQSTDEQAEMIDASGPTVSLRVDAPSRTKSDPSAN